MRRRIACVGDTLSRGGTILPYEGPIFTFGDGAGHQVAIIGERAFCSACQSTGVIAKAGGSHRMSFVTEIALHGDIVLCKCPTPSVIIAVLAGESWCDDGSASEGVFYPLDASAIAGAELWAHHHTHDQHFQILDDSTGEPIANRRYRLRCAAGMLEGYTDANGLTERVSGHEAESVTIEIY